MQNFLNINLLVLFGSLVALVGGLISLSFKPLTNLFTRYGSSFASGVLLTVSLIGLLPEAAHEMGESVFLWVLLAFLATYIFENFLFELHHHDHDSRHSTHASAIPLIIFGDTIHNFIDGAAIAASYLANPALGLTTALSTFLHEVPHEMSDFGVLLQAGWRRRKIIWLNSLSALAAFLGAYSVMIAAQTLSVVGPLLAISAGIFLYLAASDFLPKPSKNFPYKKAVVAMLLGIVTMWIALSLVPHSHVLEEDHETEHAEELI